MRVVLLETGLGGRLGATNHRAAPPAALAPISLDHQAFLGERLEQIAFEKAGILKPGVPCIVGPQPPAALAVIEQRARAIGAPLHVHGREWHARQDGDRLLVTIGDAVGTCRCRRSRAVTRSTMPGWRSPARWRSGPRPRRAALARGLRAAKWPGACSA